jgi:ParB family chromosome partitioning protein
MSVTESKAKAPVKTSKKSVKPAESAALKAALEAAQIEMVPLSALVKSPLNVRTIPIRLRVSGRWLTPSWRSA